MGRMLRFCGCGLGQNWRIHGFVVIRRDAKACSLLQLHGSQLGRFGANGTERFGPPVTLRQRETRLMSDICIITQVSRTIGALRGRAARGAPAPL
jgi:hypothetical protein